MNTKQIGARQRFEHLAYSIGFTLSDEQKNSRWEGASRLLEDADISTMLDLTHLAFDLEDKSRDGPSKAAKFFSDADESFSADAQKKELQALAGTCLALLTESPGRSGVAAGLLALCASAVGSRTPSVGFDLEKEIGNALRNRSIADRHRVQATAPRAKSRSKQIADKVAPLDEAPDWEKAKTSIKDVGAVATAYATDIETALLGELNRLKLHFDQADEELQILWWLTGSFSRDMEKPFSALDDGVRAIVSGKEAADLTIFPPGPAAIQSILFKLGNEVEPTVKLSDAVNSLPLTWRDGLNGLKKLAALAPPLFPISTAILKSVESGGDKSWLAAFSTMTGLNKSFGKSACDLSLQMYRESLLAQSIEEL